MAFEKKEICLHGDRKLINCCRREYARRDMQPRCPNTTKQEVPDNG